MIPDINTIVKTVFKNNNNYNLWGLEQAGGTVTLTKIAPPVY